MRTFALSALALLLGFGPALAAVPAKPTFNLLSKVGTYNYETILADPRVISALRKALSQSTVALARQNLEVIGPIAYADGYLVLDGIKAHEGGSEECTLLINVQTFEIIALIRHNGRKTLYSRAARYGYLPKIIRAYMALPDMDFASDAPPRDVNWPDQP